jgi:prepilin-type N-terminal cleavage/methylation domain-containing protein
MRLFKQLRATGFTLAELLVALLILGQISAFTIPKIIISSQRSNYNARAKEAASMISGAYHLYLVKNGRSGSMGISDLTPYFNYVAVDSSTVIDDVQTKNSQTCGSGSAQQCLRLHNGAILRYGLSSTYTMGGTSATNAIWFDIDPDGRYSGAPAGDGKAIEFWLYSSGRLATFGTIAAGTCSGNDCPSATPAYDPPWFSW